MQGASGLTKDHTGTMGFLAVESCSLRRAALEQAEGLVSKIKSSLPSDLIAHSYVTGLLELKLTETVDEAVLFSGPAVICKPQDSFLTGLCRYFANKWYKSPASYRS